MVDTKLLNQTFVLMYYISDRFAEPFEEELYLNKEYNLFITFLSSLLPVKR